MFARRGYDVVGIDLAENMIALAMRRKEAEQIQNVTFACLDFEMRPERLGHFDCAVFYDSLHHSDDERLAVAAAFAALKPGGVCITCEPGVGHSRSPESLQAVQKTGVNERDMEPARVIAAARAVGFTNWRVFPRARAVHRFCFGGGFALSQPGRPLWKRAANLAFDLARAVRYVWRGHLDDGLVVLTKGNASRT